MTISIIVVAVVALGGCALVVGVLVAAAYVFMHERDTHKGEG